MGMWGEYVPVHKRRAEAKKKMDSLRKKGNTIEPVTIEGRTIAKQFWGKKWCEHIESFADYDSRLPRGRTYARNGSVCHLQIIQGQINAIVSGSSLYHVKIQIKTLAKDQWDVIKKKCSGMIGSILELLQGKISANVMEIVADGRLGLFPLEKEISYNCDCPDWAGMCKHVAAVLYGIGNRLDSKPELLFSLRGVDPTEMMSIHIKQEQTQNVLQSDNLSDLFGIEIEGLAAAEVPIKPKAKKAKTQPLFDPNVITAKSIKALRDKSGLTVAQLADKLGTTPASIYRWEKAPGTLKLQSGLRESLISFANKC